MGTHRRDADQRSTRARCGSPAGVLRLLRDSCPAFRCFRSSCSAAAWRARARGSPRPRRSATRPPSRALSAATPSKTPVVDRSDAAISADRSDRARSRLRAHSARRRAAGRRPARAHLDAAQAGGASSSAFSFRPSASATTSACRRTSTSSSCAAARWRAAKSCRASSWRSTPAASSRRSKASTPSIRASACPRAGSRPTGALDAEAYGYVVVEPSTVVATHSWKTSRPTPPSCSAARTCRRWSTTLKKTHPALVEDVSAKLSLGALHRVLQRLLRERVPIRDLVTILEALGDAGDRRRIPRRSPSTSAARSPTSSCSSTTRATAASAASRWDRGSRPRSWGSSPASDAPGRPRRRARGPRADTSLARRSRQPHEARRPGASAHHAAVAPRRCPPPHRAHHATPPDHLARRAAGANAHSQPRNLGASPCRLRPIAGPPWDRCSPRPRPNLATTR